MIDFNNLIETSSKNGFQPYCDHSEEADAINVYFTEDCDYSERLTDHVTLLRSFATNEITGCRIKNVSAIMADLPNFIEVEEGGTVALRVLFLSFRGGHDDARDAFNELAEKADDMMVPV